MTLPDSLADRAALGSGRDFWSTKVVGDIPSISLIDGPHGVRKQATGGDNLGIAASLPATCFPPAVGLGQSWDPRLVERVGRALGDECQAADVQVLLGPGINIKRSPLGGRNFEYFSEDPLVSGMLGSAWVRGIQSRGVGASLKHFALYNQEADRMRTSSDVDPRPLREIYLRGFRRAVTEAKPWTVMSSYNRVNGVRASENPFLLTQILRDEWGFDGVVVCDWGAVVDRVAAVRAGLDLQMPDDGGAGDADVVRAVEAGTLDQAAVDRAATAVAALAERGRAGHRDGVVVDVDAHHELAREAAGKSIVLLRNEGSVLPLAAGGSIAVIGEFARTPRYQGGGSSNVNPTRLDVPVDSIREAAPGASVSFSPGFTIDGSDSEAILAEEAVAAAAAADAAVLFLGPDAGQQTEGIDRTEIDLPAGQLALLAAVAAVQPRVVVVLSHGGALRLAPVVASAPAILDAALLGQAVGSAVADVLFGAVNPSGKLTETAPVRLEDTPAYLDYLGEYQHVRYGEGMFVGYRWYDARDLDVTFPFGHGLSYTTFAYSPVSLSVEGDDVLAALTITNSGSRAGREVVQAYVSVPGSKQVRVRRSLGGFASVELEAGESRDVVVRIERSELEYWDIRLDRFVLEPGDYGISVGSSSRDLRTHAVVHLEGEHLRIPLDIESTLSEVMANPVGAPLVKAAMRETPFSDEGSEALGMDLDRMMQSIPLERLITFSGGKVTRDHLEDILDKANAS
ncbi:glycoside hydrolase family 3 C-terminal domain-containing protein [Frondihabitans cladoniiphilus]|uniref:Glycoside hydrolase family 3 C-terminal domain-containing protein n=1 Tax=Frondihabitans cladoniiphilus TaxID=715785 RepID=A0ABP8W3S7_9MICO